MRRIPVISTVVVALAIAAMIALGVWQLDRRDEKEAAIATLAANSERPAITYPGPEPLPQALWFRRSAVDCRAVEGWTVEAGRAADGVTGYRYIARCRTGPGEAPAQVAIGVANRPGLEPQWTGGVVTGRVVPQRDSRSLIGIALGRGSAPGPLLIADEARAGLRPPAAPSVESVPNNHLSYAVQWFLFALAAAIIYPLALRYRNRRRPGERQPA